jgi:radical SAM superfamily enzyme YgiQ (UPF0313 family)
MLVFGCYTNEFPDVLHLASCIKKIDGQIKIIIGGVHPTLKPDDFFFRDSPFDFITIGEAEITLYELIKALEERQSVENVKGITYIDRGSNKVIKTPPRMLVDDLDELPFPAFDKVDMKYYTRPNPYAIRGVFLPTFYNTDNKRMPFQLYFLCQ